ncbi:unnamed protein product [Colletotrichum noveboracense]|uniref:Protein kinase domain-containing protein n=1 Tax=Colletotrichum noveboracense TaxID=2664923 RepID=A0A9W4RY73_9PEZI|nr:unnamed protein product [Colletotrichum noveboracense]
MSQPQTLQAYLEACHSLSLAIQIITDRSLTTQGDTTNPTGRIFPRRIIPWDDFATAQEGIWAQLPPGASFSSQPLFPSQHQLDYVMTLLSPISSEIGLRNFERDTVENMVQKLIDEAYKNPHTNLVETDDSLSEHLDRISIERDDTGQPASASRPPSRKPRRRARGKGNRVDQFCIYRTSDGRNIPALAIEYKAPHKLGRNEVVTGLASEIQPERDVINKNGEGFAFVLKALVAAVVTQLFSYMIGKGIRYGYVCTGEVFVFLHIPDDPTSVYYYVCVPNLDVLDDDENRLHHTAVAGVFEHFLFLSWAGLPLFETIQQTTQADIIKKAATAYKEIHKLHILHRDAEPRNIVYDQGNGRVMIVDFERAEFRSRQPLSSLSPNA